MGVNTVKCNTFMDTSFFNELSKLKLDELKLNDQGIPIEADISVRPNQPLSISLNNSSFNITENGKAKFSGEVINVNTLEEFKRIPKRELLHKWSKNIDVNRLRFIGVLMFADLKKYKYYYWNCYPTFNPKFEMTEICEVELAVEYSGEQFLINDENTIMFEFNEKGQFDSCLNNLVMMMSKRYNKERFELVVKRNSEKLATKYEIVIKEADEGLLTGWERTINDKLGPKVIDLRLLIDPMELSKQARDLNLKLMKWRLSPELNLDLIKEQKCLLLGSGTLGTYVGRLLLAWGIDDITFVDNGRISFSNPVRQPLYEFNDCVEDGGGFKSIISAKNLAKVYPNGNIKGEVLEVPMIGHPVTDNTRENYQTLVNLINEHDVIFLLMDSSEARWLPTALGFGMNKVVINAALGYDSFVVMRHGVANNKLGCYYCSNVNAPGDSSIDKTLDQMCTVTRPGLAPIASGVAVEMMIDILQSKEGIKSDHSEELPQQIRGYLNQWRFNKFMIERFEHCVGCNSHVVEMVKEWEEVKLLLMNKGFLEEVSGLKDLITNVTYFSEEEDDYEYELS